MKNNDIIAHPYTIHAIYEGNDINPNGDPDNKGAPRADQDTGHGRVSGASFMRGVVDRAALLHAGEPGFDLQIKRDSNIDDTIKAAAKKAGIKPDKKLPMAKRKTVATTVAEMYFDARMGGSVLNVGACPAENLNATVTSTWGRSVHPLHISEDAITRLSATKEEQEKNQEMGRKYSAAYGVYRQSFFVNPFHAAQNGATMRDLAIYLDCAVNRFEFKRSGMSGQINMRGMWVFRHSNPHGDAPAYRLLESIKCDSSKGPEARSWDDYTLEFDRKTIPQSIKIYTIEDLMGGEEAILERLLAD